MLNYGSMKALAGLNGTVPGCDFGEHTNYYDINGSYALIWDDGLEKHMVVNAAGWTSQPFDSVRHWGSAYIADASDKGVVLAYGWGMDVIDTNTGRVSVPVEQYHNDEKPKYALMEDGMCYLGDGTLCTEFTLCGDGDACATFRVNGKYGLVRKSDRFDGQIVAFGNEAAGFDADKGIPLLQKQHLFR